MCNNDTTLPVTFTTDNTGGVTTYAWTNDTPGIGLAASGDGDIDAFVAVNTGTSPVTATITVVPTFTNQDVSCIGPSETFTITVNPTGQVDDPQDQVLCNNDDAIVEFTTDNTGGTTVYGWSSDLDIGFGTAGQGNINSTAVNTGTSPITATITVTPSFEGCIGPSETFTITVNPTGQVDDPQDQVLCNNDDAIVEFTTDNTGGTTVYGWSSDLDIGFGTAGQGNINSTAVNTGTSPITATITVTPSFEGCIGPSETFTITVNPTGQVDDPQDQVLCNNDTTLPVTFTTDNTGGVTTYAWTNDTPGIGLAASGDGDIDAFVAVNTGTSPVTATITVVPTFTNQDVSCIGPSETFTITVNPGAQIDIPENQVLCSGEQLVVNFSTENSGSTTTYEWTSDLDIGGGLSGAGNIDFTVLNEQLSLVTATFTVIPTLENEGVPCFGSSVSFTVQVNGTLNPNVEISDYNGLDIVVLALTMVL